jgi:hypothetical protein
LERDNRGHERRREDFGLVHRRSGLDSLAAQPKFLNAGVFDFQEGLYPALLFNSTRKIDLCLSPEVSSGNSSSNCNYWNGNRAGPIPCLTLSASPKLEARRF